VKERGQKRLYRKGGGKEERRKGEGKESKMIKKEWGDMIIVALLSVGGVISRQLFAEEPGKVTWDEAHFGKFLSGYLQRKLFFDVHPPGGKILLALIGHLSGYQGGFSFDSERDYPQEVPYAAIRMVCGALGGMVVPLLFLSARRARLSSPAALLAAAMALLDLSLVALSRLILLDPFLLFFTALSVYALFSFIAFRTRFIFFFFFPSKTCSFASCPWILYAPFLLLGPFRFGGFFGSLRPAFPLA